MGKEKSNTETRGRRETIRIDGEANDSKADLFWAVGDHE
jgi:hypothetical protein